MPGFSNTVNLASYSHHTNSFNTDKKAADSFCWLLFIDCAVIMTASSITSQRNLYQKSLLTFDQSTISCYMKWGVAKDSSDREFSAYPAQSRLCSTSQMMWEAVQSRPNDVRCMQSKAKQCELARQKQSIKTWEQNQRNIPNGHTCSTITVQLRKVLCVCVVSQFTKQVQVELNAHGVCRDLWCDTP